MKHDNKLDESLKNLDKDIIWSKDRQQHIRNKLIDDMRQSKASHVTKGRGKVLPALSMLLMAAILIIIVLSEFNITDMTKQDHVTQRPSASKGEDHPEIIPHDSDDLPADPENQTGSELNAHDRLLTQTEIMEAIKDQMTTDLPLKLPTKISLPEGKHLTAITFSNTNSYEVIFYQHDEPIPINNKRLFADDNPAEVVVRIHANKFDTREEADDAVSHETFDENMGDPIRLSEGIIGYQDAGGGSTWTSWNVGRWAVTTHARSNDSERGVSLAKEIIAYLDKYLLPAPRQNGYAHLDAESVDNRIIWEKETTVYTIDQVSNPLKALEITVNFEK